MTSRPTSSGAGRGEAAPRRLAAAARPRRPDLRPARTLRTARTVRNPRTGRAAGSGGRLAAARTAALGVAVALAAGCGATPPATSPGPSASGSTGATGTSAPAGTSTGTRPTRLTWQACGAATVGAQCAGLPVPLDRAAPGAGRLDLAVLRLPATDPARRIGSLVINPGGPGVSGVSWLAAAGRALPAELRARFDLVSFDPRGVGQSRAVDCLDDAQTDAYYEVDATPDDEAERVALATAQTGLAAACLRTSAPMLGHVATADVAADLEDLRIALGDERLTFLGYSYGTLIAAAYLQRYGDHVRAMLLDGGVDPALDESALLQAQAAGFEQAWGDWVRACLATGCLLGSDEPTVSRRVELLLTGLDRRPIPVAGRWLDESAALSAMLAAMYAPSAWDDLGLALRAAERGDGAALLAMADTFRGRDADGTYDGTLSARAAVECLDRPGPRNVEAFGTLADQVAETSPTFGRFLAWTGSTCLAWPVSPVDQPRPASRDGGGALLVLATSRDPATPPAWGYALATQLAPATVVLVEGAGHTAFGQGLACVDDAGTRYLVDLVRPAAPATCPGHRPAGTP